jgi:hypothetical protein
MKLLYFFVESWQCISPGTKNMRSSEVGATGWIAYWKKNKIGVGYLLLSNTNLNAGLDSGSAVRNDKTMELTEDGTGQSVIF